MEPSERLDPRAERVREMGEVAVEFAARYYEALRDVPVYPRTSAAELKELLEEPLPQEGRDFAQLMRIVRDVIAPNGRHNGHPRFFGYASAPGTAVAAVADFLASVLNPNLTAWRSAPAPTQLERVTIDWIRQALGCEPGAGGLFTSGGSMANFAGLAAARQRCGGEALSERGLQALSRPLRIYASEEVHHSIDKSAALLGIGHENVRRVAVDRRYRMDIGDLARKIEADLAAGAQPMCVVASAGTVVTGAVDPLEDVVALARRHGLWVHVDACYGGFARFAPSVRPLFEGLRE